MWYKLSRFIIVYRLWLVLTTLAITAWMGWKGSKLEMSYDYAQVIPANDPDWLYFQAFKKKFGEDANVMVIGFQDPKLFNYEHFKDFYQLNEEIKQIEGIKEVISLTSLKRLDKDTAMHAFVLHPVFTKAPLDQQDLDSNLHIAQNIPLYQGLIYNPETKATLIAVSLKREFLNSKHRAGIVEKMLAMTTAFSQKHEMKVHYAGLPYIRTIMVGKFQKEFKMLLYLSVLVTCLILYFFFRTYKAVLFTVLVIGITVIWTTGLVVLFGYKITLLTGILPALIVVLSIPNCIYMFNKYHQEYKKHNNKVKAISRMVEKIGFLTFMTNANTAVGFLVLLITDITIMKEFGMIAGLMSLATFVISIIVVPSLLMYLPEPTEKQLMHLDKKMITWMTQTVSHWVVKYRPMIYATNALLIVLAIWGITKIRVVSYMVDDLPESDNVKTDLQFFENNFAGVMPLEILVDMGKPKAIYKIKNLQKLDELDQTLRGQKNISPPLSIINIVKSATDAFYDHYEGSYRLPSNQEKNFILPYFSKKSSDLGILRSFVDSTGQVARFSMKVADLGTDKMRVLLDDSIRPKINAVFEGTPYKVNIIGTTLIFLKGNEYLFNDLAESLLYAFILISLMMAFLFADVRMILISIIPNLIPMIITAGIMGFFDIRIKTSTAIIFSISFGITIDSTIHFLSKFKQELALQGATVLDAVLHSMKEACISMVYTSLVLVIGFGIFLFSEFGGTMALGLLTCITLIFAMLTNLILLPALLVNFAKKKEKRPS